jgi:hypothetical protein
VKCECCDTEAKYSIWVCRGLNHADDGVRFYLPNQAARGHPTETSLGELWLCHSCMRRVEDNFRATIGYLKEEGLTRATEESPKGETR